MNTKIVWFFVTSAVFWGGCVKEVPQRPNFLVILTDDQPYRAIGYNNEQVKTPNLDRLANGGMIFSRAYISTPVCAASRASLLTGLYPQTNGTVALNSSSFIENIVNGKKYPTLPLLLNEAGYITGFCGKSHLGPPVDYGFRYGEESMDFDDKRAFEDASEFVDRIAAQETDQPFFLWFAARQPHVPLHPGQEWLDLYNSEDISLDKNFREKPLSESFFNQGLPGMNFYRDSDYTDNHKNLPAGPPRSPEIMKEFIHAYYATISHLDFQVGQLIEKMESKGLMENTMIIFLSDNGYFLGNHGLGNKLTMHEESVRIPFFIYWDKLKEKSKSTDALISSIDIFPTILEAAGIGIPENIQGISMYPLLSGSRNPIRGYVVSESVGVGGSLGEGHRMVVADEWKYMLSGIGDEALFNLKEDAYELDNQIKNPERMAVINRLKTNLQEWKILTGDQKKIPGLLNAFGEGNTKKPNLVLILADDLGYADLGIHGSKQIPTPNIDRLGQEGIVFSSGYVSSTVCSPSRAGLLTGKNQLRFGYNNNLSPSQTGFDPEYQGLPVTEKTLADKLKSLGYVTGLTGKWHLGEKPQFFPVKRGFDEFWGFLGGGHNYFIAEPDGEDLVSPIYCNYKEPGPLTYMTDDIGNESAGFIRRHRDAPFFLFASFNAPHSPMQALEEDLQLFSHIEDELRRIYCAMVYRLDINVGKILTTLREEGLEQNTFVVFISDNGGPVQDNGSLNAPLNGQKTTLLEGGIRVPFIFKWPEMFPAGKVRGEVVSALDIFPSFIEAAGGNVKPEDGLDGMNLIPFISEPSREIPPRSLKWGYTVSMAIRDGDWKLIRLPDRLPMLFNLSEDVSEQNDVALQNLERTRNMLNELGKWDIHMAQPRFLEPISWRIRHLGRYDMEYQLVQPEK